MSIEQIGTVEILRARTYPLDPETREAGTEVIVGPGTYPVYSDGLTTFWMMTGDLSDGGVRRHGDGMLTVTNADVPSGVAATFPSRRMGSDEFRDLLDHPVCREGGDEQRLRFTLAKDGAPA